MKGLEWRSGTAEEVVRAAVTKHFADEVKGIFQLYVRARGWCLRMREQERRWRPFIHPMADVVDASPQRQATTSVSFRRPALARIAAASSHRRSGMLGALPMYPPLGWTVWPCLEPANQLAGQPLRSK